MSDSMMSSNNKSAWTDNAISNVPTDKNRTKTCDIKRNLPDWAKVVKTINGLPIYNINIFDNIMSWNSDNLDTPAFDYFGNTITYRELPSRVNEYVCAFRTLGVSEGDVVTLCMPVSVENMLALLALNCLGAISNNVNFLFLKNNFTTYTKAKKSDALMVLDAFLPFVVDHLVEADIKTVIVTNLSDYLKVEDKNRFSDFSSLPENLREIYDNKEKQDYCRALIPKLKGISFIRTPDFIKLGKANYNPINPGPVDVDRDSCYSYTSGTTGKPKCIVYKEYSTNAFIEMHAGLDTKDYVGERVFQVIPLTHATGERVSGYLPLAKGKTLVPIPIYNKNTFGEDLANSKCNWVVAAPSFYIAASAHGDLNPEALTNVTRPTSGGEPITKCNVRMVDRWLMRNGCQTRFAIGGGSAEDGSGTLFTYFMNDETKTNETGQPIDPYIKVKIVGSNGQPVEKGERGIFHASSPAAADRYLNDSKATQSRWYIDNNGVRWGITGDVAVENPDGSYTVLGRDTDSYIDNEGQKHYLFDIEYALEDDDPVYEWEITEHTTKEGNFVVGQVVLKDKNAELPYVIKHLCEKYGLDAIKIYSEFVTSEVTGKRDYQLLKNDKDGYYAPCDSDHLYQLSFSNGSLKKVKLPMQSISAL